MATKINDVSSSLMANSVSTMLETKTRKAEAAFQSFFDHAVAGNASQNKTDVSQCLTAKSDKHQYSYDETEKNLKETSEPQSGDKVQTKQSSAVTKEDAEQLSDTEKPEKILDDIAGEMGISRKELMEHFEELMDSIAAILMEKFGVTQEELTLVLDNLGLSLTDMFNQTNLMNVAMALSGVEDISAVLTDENLYGQIQEAAAELALVKESMLSDKQLNPETLKVIENCIEIAKTDKADEESPVMKENFMDTGADDMAVTDREPVLEIVTDKKDASMDKNQGQQMTGNEAFQQFTGRVAENVQQLVTGTDFVQQTDMEAIIRQVTDYVKMQVHADTTSLEMQLHPESYGKLNLQVSVREGVVTARLAVENEMVRQALETQLVQLREDMSERGLKVDSVEVAIASHEFERNLEEGQENSQASYEEAATARRHINLREDGMSLEELTAMSEAEALTRKIMLENGNSIDFSA